MSCDVNRDHTILVVEDDQNDQFMIFEAFRQSGWENPIQLLPDAHEAIAYLKGEGKYNDRTRFSFPAFIVTDLKMPRSNGFELLEYCKQHPECGGVPPAVLSASRDADDVLKAYVLGAGCYLEKPISFIELQRKIKTLHEHWLQCKIPALDVHGKRISTKSVGKLGEHYGLSR